MRILAVGITWKVEMLDLLAWGDLTKMVDLLGYLFALFQGHTVCPQVPILTFDNGIADGIELVGHRD